MYEIRWLPYFATEAVAANFSDTLDRTISESVITGNDDFQKVYLVPTDGIYQVAIHLRPM